MRSSFPRTAETVPAVLGKDDLIVSRSEEHTSELQSQSNLVCRLLLEKKKNIRRSPEFIRRAPGTLTTCQAAPPTALPCHCPRHLPVTFVDQPSVPYLDLRQRVSSRCH